MIDSEFENKLIYNEFSTEQREHFFKRSNHKFLHNIDTFYYSVLLYNDFDTNTDDENVIYLRNYFKRFGTDSFDVCTPIHIDNCNVQLNYRNFSFGGFYKTCIECPEEFDIFIADSVPTDITSQIIVQIRSCSLWLNGVQKAFEKSYEVIQAICEQFKLQVQEVKENRIDYCWHTNCIQRADVYLAPQRFADMEVSRFNRINYQYQLKKINNEIESDYISLGKRSDKCFVRIYLKSKEVVEKGYKSWFLKLWFFNGLINFYDLYVYERLFILRKWKKIDVVRLQFYLEFGSNDLYKHLIHQLIDSDNLDYTAINKLANELTPAVTMIINIEYQTTRKSSKSYCLIKYKDNSKYGVAARIYDYLDNRRMITDYLTHSTLRLVDLTKDSNKSRAPYTDFWNRLRNTKQIDVSCSNNRVKLIREYARNLDKELVKKRMCNAVVTYTLYCKGINEDKIRDDVVGAMVRLNDNDIENMKRFKGKKIKQLNHQNFNGMLENANCNIGFIDLESGELL